MTKKDRLIAPLVVLPAKPPPSTVLSAVKSDAPVSITSCYAGLFARLPSLSQIYQAPHESAQALYNATAGAFGVAGSAITTSGGEGSGEVARGGAGAVLGGGSVAVTPGSGAAIGGGAE